MNATLQQVAEKIPFISAPKPPEPEIGYTDVDKDGRPIPPVFVFLTPESFDDAENAAQALGYLALATNLRERKAHGFQPVMTDELMADEKAIEEWDKGNYDPNVFYGQGAVALRWLLEEAASNPERGRAEGHVLSSRLATRMALLNETTTSLNDIKSPVLPVAVRLSEEIQAQGPSASALITTEGSLTKLQETGGIDYDVIHDTDPGIPKYPHDSAA